MLHDRQAQRRQNLWILQGTKADPIPVRIDAIPTPSRFEDSVHFWTYWINTADTRIETDTVGNRRVSLLFVGMDPDGRKQVPRYWHVVELIRTGVNPDTGSEHWRIVDRRRFHSLNMARRIQRLRVEELRPKKPGTKNES